jgi:hypothetical protein
VFARYLTYRDKKVVGVLCVFIAPLHQDETMYGFTIYVVFVLSHLETNGCWSVVRSSGFIRVVSHGMARGDGRQGHTSPTSVRILLLLFGRT